MKSVPFPLCLTQVGLLLIAVAVAYVLLPVPQQHVVYASPTPPPIRPQMSRDVTLHLTLLAPHTVQVSWTCPGRPQHVTVYRSTTDLGAMPNIDLMRWPIVATDVAAVSPWKDDSLADHATCYYQVDVDGKWSAVESIDTPNVVMPPTITSPTLHVHKLHYYLEVGGKRFPIALGHNPVRRKLNQDNASTPEGHYHIAGVQSHATYYRAYDVDYPNHVDHERYDYAKLHGLLESSDGSVPGIGGEIEIHGDGIIHNWTFGCMAMRNEDMDELMAHKEIGVGTPIIITGSEVRQ
ncbi:MAG: L,D-transpeptidase family protein [Candidatus Xenobia bacterium]